MVNLKIPREIELIKVAAKISAQALQLGGELCKAGVTSFEIDEAINRFIVKQGAYPSFLHYNGFPASCCISLNDVIIHGIPSKQVVLKEGDIVSIDVGACYKGYHGDNAFTFKVGDVGKQIEEFLEVSKKSLENAIEKAVVGNRIGDISSAVEETVKPKGYGIVREFVGHGVGKNLHEEPEIPNFGKKGKGMRLFEGMVIAIEPMINKAGDGTVRCKDGWAVKTASGEVSAHFEHTVVITKDGPLVVSSV